MNTENNNIKIIVKNKRAHFDYFLLERVEAGIALVGTEVKSLRAGKAIITDAFVQIDNRGEMWLYNMTIPHYEFGNLFNHQENRRRKLLVKKIEIKKIAHEMKVKHLQLIPVTLYFKSSKVKIEIALAKGKKLYDKRETIAERDVSRKIRQNSYDD
ncbi:MAG: SsrA-binding protein SmpB [Bacteriovoracaceae bacterium]